MQDDWAGAGVREWGGSSMGHLCVVRVEIMVSGQADVGMGAGQVRPRTGKETIQAPVDCVGGSVGTASVGAELEVVIV